MRLIINDTQRRYHNTLRSTMDSYNAGNEAARIELSQLEIWPREIEDEARATNDRYVNDCVDELRMQALSLRDEVPSEQEV